MHPSVHQNSVGVVDVGWADIDFGEVLGSTVVASCFVVAAYDGFVVAYDGFAVASASQSRPECLPE